MEEPITLLNSHTPKPPPSLPLVFFFFLLLLPISTTTFTPAINILLTCGSTSPVSSPDSRTFTPDSDHLSSTNSQSIPNPSSSSSPLYSTARIFKTASFYQFPIQSFSSYFLRLHFYPFTSSSANLSSARFSVNVSGVVLLSGFTPSSGDPNDKLVIKEFLLNVSTSTAITLTFAPQDGSVAYVNAVELFSGPTGVFPSSSDPVSISGPPSFSTQVLETSYRINIGGDKVDSTTDPVWRSWDADGEFLLNKTLGHNISISTKINYEDTGTSTPEIAPTIVYQSARVMYQSSISATPSSPNWFNLTWVLQVNSGGTYLIRMHFCDIVSQTLDEFNFNAYLNNQTAIPDYDISANSFQTATPYYRDFLIDMSSSMQLLVGVGPFYSSSHSKINAILNGLEVMQLINGNLTSSPAKSKSGIKSGVVIGCVVAVCLVIIAIVVLVMRRRKKKRMKLEPEPEPQPERASRRSGYWSPLLAFTSRSSTRLMERSTDTPTANLNLGLKIPLIDVRAATNNFDQSRQIGSGGFGKVYKGYLQDGTSVAVKRATPGSKQGFPEFQTEINVLSRIRHRHLVSLIGYCDEQGEMILVYEYMDKGTLREHLYNSSSPSLPWKQRLEICIGSARGLHYLHTADSQAIIHRDVKSANILLDQNYLAKVADFGLSKQGPPVNQTHVSTGVKGSFGYLDPEYFKTQQLTEKSDVYSFGVVLLEVVCARPVIDPSLPYDQVNLADWGIRWLKRDMLEQIIDQRLRGEINPSSLRKFGETILKCLAPYGVDRPPIADVLWNLEYTLQLQETTVRREPYEDSMSNPSEVLMVNVRRMPSTNTHGFPDASTTDVDMEWGGSQVFSQMISADGR